MFSVAKESKNGNHKNTNHVFPRWFTPMLQLPSYMGRCWIGECLVADLIDLRPSYNDETRTDIDSGCSGIRKLMASLKLHKLNQLPVVNRKGLVDGSRRVTALFHNRQERVVVLYRPRANETTFAEVNATQKRHTSKQRTFTWLRKPGGVVDAVNKQL